MIGQQHGNYITMYKMRSWICCKGGRASRSTIYTPKHLEYAFPSVNRWSLFSILNLLYCNARYLRCTPFQHISNRLWWPGYNGDTLMQPCRQVVKDSGRGNVFVLAGNILTYFTYSPHVPAKTAMYLRLVGS